MAKTNPCNHNQTKIKLEKLTTKELDNPTSMKDRLFHNKKPNHVVPIWYTLELVNGRVVKLCEKEIEKEVEQW